MKQLVTIGRLVNVEIYDPKTKKTTKRTLRGKWLATSPHGRDLHICKVTGKSPAKVSPAVRKRHKRFHAAEPKGVMAGEIPDPKGKLTQVGLIKALTYTVPQSRIRSPEKNPYHWHHKFGDTGHEGGTYPPRYYPALMQDSQGNLFIRRRKGNIFKTTDWIRG